jgi:FkbM family methyltransferase
MIKALARAWKRVEMFPPRLTYAAGGLHRKILDRFGFHGGVFFEAGANDGLRCSNTAYLGRHLGWTGILVEPIPHKAAACRANRPEAHTVEAALVPFDYPFRMLTVAFADMMTISPLSDIPVADHLEAARPHMNGEDYFLGERFNVSARTAQAVIDEAGNPPINLFVLDVEGAERSVLDGLDFSRTRPRHMLIEVRDLPAMAAFLAAKGYGPPERLSKMDYLFADHWAVIFTP